MLNYNLNYFQRPIATIFRRIFKDLILFICLTAYQHVMGYLRQKFDSFHVWLLSELYFNVLLHFLFVHNFFT